ncbi:hypothetical protein [Neobacillus sp. Marseille-QA0830]
MLDHRFYDKHQYPLQRFSYPSIPERMLTVLYKLTDQFEYVVRGGLCYILNTGDVEYPLKDIDLAMDAGDTEAIYSEIWQDADFIYLNQNSFGQDVLTLFFKAGEELFLKIDILLVNKLPHHHSAVFAPLDRTVQIMDPSELWYDRIRKIAEKDLRGHSPDKTLNHYHVVTKLSEYSLKNKNVNAAVLKEIGLGQVKQKLNDSYEVLTDLLHPEQLHAFKNITQGVLQQLGPT